MAEFSSDPCIDFTSSLVNYFLSLQGLSQEAQIPDSEYFNEAVCYPYLRCISFWL